MTEKLRLQPIHDYADPITVRDYSGRDGIVIQREASPLAQGSGFGDKFTTTFYSNVTVEGAIALRDWLLERYPLEAGTPETFEPRTVKDLDGDFWVEVVPDVFEMKGGSLTRSLDYIEANYGIDDEPARKAPAFEVGDRIRIGYGRDVSCHRLNPMTRATVVEVEDGYEGVAYTIEDDGTNYAGFRFEGRRYVEESEIEETPDLSLYRDQGYLQKEEPLAEWERELLGMVEEQDAKPALPKEGSIVRLVPKTRGFSADDGALARVTKVEDSAPWSAGHPVLSLEWIHGANRQSPGRYEAADFEPASRVYAEGDRVRLTAPHWIADREVGGFEYAEAPNGIGSLATVVGMVDVWGKGESVRVRWDGSGDRTSVVASASLSPFVPDEAGDPTGVQVYVTGDADSWLHGFEVGTLVEVMEGGDDLLVDGSYFVRDRRTGREEFVGANDLDVENPVQEVPFEEGDRVRVGESPKTVGGGWVDPKTAGEIGVVVNGPTSAGNVRVRFPGVRDLLQAIDPAHLTKVEAEPRRCVCGDATCEIGPFREVEIVDPTTAPGYCDVCRTAPCRLIG